MGHFRRRPASRPRGNTGQGSARVRAPGRGLDRPAATGRPPAVLPRAGHRSGDRAEHGCRGLQPARRRRLALDRKRSPAVRAEGLAEQSEPLIDGVVAAKALADRNRSAIDQLALAQFIVSGAYDRHIRRSRLIYRRRRDRLVAALRPHAPRVRISGIAAGPARARRAPGRRARGRSRRVRQTARARVHRRRLATDRRAPRRYWLIAEPGCRRAGTRAARRLEVSRRATPTAAMIAAPAAVSRAMFIAVTNAACARSGIGAGR
jgi:hypothetical protein